MFSLCFCTWLHFWGASDGISQLSHLHVLDQQVPDEVAAEEGVQIEKRAL